MGLLECIVVSVAVVTLGCIKLAGKLIEAERTPERRRTEMFAEKRRILERRRSALSNTCTMYINEGKTDQGVRVAVEIRAIDEKLMELAEEEASE